MINPTTFYVKSKPVLFDWLRTIKTDDKHILMINVKASWDGSKIVVESSFLGLTDKYSFIVGRYNSMFSLTKCGIHFS